jgi:hypothetical protein
MRSMREVLCRNSNIGCSEGLTGVKARTLPDGLASQHLATLVAAAAGPDGLSRGPGSEGGKHVPPLRGEGDVRWASSNSRFMGRGDLAAAKVYGPKNLVVRPFWRHEEKYSFL